MQKKVSLLFGVALILIALVALAGNLLTRTLGVGIGLGFRAWPIFVIASGLFFCVPPFIYNHSRGLSGLFIPGIPTLTTGMLLFFASITGHWSIWAVLWPLEVLSVALGFALMAVFLRNPWLSIPASIIGVTGLVLQFCAATGLWASWAVLWTVVPFSIGLPLLVIGTVSKNEGVKLAGIILTGFAAVAFAAMSTILASFGWVTGLVGPIVVLGLGAWLIYSALMRKKEPEYPQAVPESEEH
jgi:hypothetical protein